MTLMDVADYVGGGPAEALASMATGMVAQPVGGLAGLVGALLPGEPGQGAAVSEKVSNALTYKPRTKAGTNIAEVLGLPGALVNKAANAVGERGAQVSPALGTIGKSSVAILPVLFGARAALKPKAPLTVEQQRVAKMRDQGFTMTPKEMGAGEPFETAGSLAGEPRLAKINTAKNTAVATAKAKAELGLPKDATLDLDTLADLRRQAGKAYEAVRNVGQVGMDQKYLSDLDALASKYRSAAKDFPGLAKPEVEQVIAALKKEDPTITAMRAQGANIPDSVLPHQSFDANSAVDMIGQLRESADKAFRSGDTGIAKVYRGGADALEGQIERHLEAAGDTSILPAYRAARQQIAKTYAVQKALVGDEVNLRSLAKQAEKGKPLSGGLKESADFARQFERSSQKPTHMPTGATLHDMGLAILNMFRTGGASFLRELPFLFARPAMRVGLSSKAGQYLMDPRTNLSTPTMEALGAASVPRPQEENR